MKTKLFVTLVASFLVTAGVVAYSAPTFAQGPTPYPPLQCCPLDDGVFTVAWIPKALNNPAAGNARNWAGDAHHKSVRRGPWRADMV